ncbi:MAG: hypothetical protein DLM50_01555 [Candidatus Meridianibacter frigidus]|nr:MAG: hypothetical protein DLM50_01555 [Candidatus Eremiobacteraeota bacterium]
MGLGRFWLLLVAAVLFGQAAPALASKLPAQASAVLAFDDGDQQADEEQAHDRGVVRGEVVDVDYARDSVVLQTHRGRITILISPGTNIVRRDSSYGTISDLAKGTRAAFYVSEVAGHLVAQLIRIQ